MKIRISYVPVIAIFALLACSRAAAQAEWKADLTAYLAEPDGQRAEALAAQIVNAGPSWQEVCGELENMQFPAPKVSSGLIPEMFKCSDGAERPYVVYVPPAYDPLTPTPLLLFLHGGVSDEQLESGPIGYCRKNPFLQTAEQHNWLMLFPFGQKGATWWDRVGMDMVLQEIRQMKSRYNVDDNRVWMTGFSDGGSAAYLFALLYPTDFAAFVPLNGHMGVGALDGKLATYAPNLANSPLHCINTDLDPLYPAAEMRKMIDMALAAGADIDYREYNGLGHTFDYAAAELPVIARFLTASARNPLSPRLTWETAGQEGGQCRWFRIDRISLAEPADWYRDWNLALTDTRVSFGFFPDFEYDGQGIKISSLAEGDSLSKRLGLQAGDVLQRCGEMAINTGDDLAAFKATVERGSQVTVQIEREGGTMNLQGHIPDPENYLLFPRSQPSAAAHVTVRANKISIQGSRLERFTAFIHPDLFQLDQELVIELNGSEVSRTAIVPSVGYIIRNFRENRDRRALYVAEVSVDTRAPLSREHAD